jgi:putrescine transport system substrate-binding protein
MHTKRAANDNVVNFYGWSGAIPRSVFNAFEKETGIKVTVDTFDDNGTAEAKILSGNSGYDVVAVSLVPHVGRQCMIGVYLKLDETLLPNLKNLGRVITYKFSRNGGDIMYTVPLFWGTVGIIYDEEVLDKVFGEGVDVSCDLIFNPENISKLNEKGVCFPTEAIDVFMQVGAYLGLSPYESEKDMDACARALINIRPYITKFEVSTAVQDILCGDICAALCMSDHAFRATQMSSQIGRKIKYAQTGTMWVDCLGIPITAPNKENAHKLINFLMRPENAASIANYSGILVNIQGVEKFYADEIRRNKQICPGEMEVEKLVLGHISHNSRDISLEKRAERMWTNIKARSADANIFMR